MVQGYADAQTKSNLYDPGLCWPRVEWGGTLWIGMGRDQESQTLSDEHNARGIELADRGWLEEAVKEFKKAIELDPASSHAHDNLGTILAERGDWMDALMAYVEAVKVAPESATARHYLASFLCGAGHDLAIDQFRIALDLDPELADSHLNLGLALAEKGELESAYQHLQTAHALLPGDHTIQHELACLLIDLQRYPDAIGHLKDIVRAKPQALEAHIDLGVAYTAQGLYTQAERTLLDALDVDPEHGPAHYHLAALYAHWARGDEALLHLQYALSAEDSQIQWWLGEDRMFDSLRSDPRFTALLETSIESIHVNDRG